MPAAANRTPATGQEFWTHIPHAFFEKLRKEKILDFDLPAAGKYAVGMFFFPNDEVSIDFCKKEINKAAASLNFKVLGFRKVATDNSDLGPSSRSVEPHIEQIFFTKNEYLKEKPNSKDFDRKLFVLRKLITQNIVSAKPEYDDDFYITSLTSRIVIYKGQLTSHQVRRYYPDLSDPDFSDLDCPCSLAVCDQYRSALEVGATVSMHFSQRRNQYGSGEYQLGGVRGKQL